jgi:hypothetical protein
MSYCDYTYYSTTYLGTAITSAAFPQLALRASAIIDALTFQQAAEQTDADIIDLIKMATCAVAEQMKVINDSGDMGGIKSESVGSHSVTYAENNESMKSIGQKYSDAAALYLISTNLMYRGFSNVYTPRYDAL